MNRRVRRYVRRRSRKRGVPMPRNADRILGDIVRYWEKEGTWIRFAVRIFLFGDRLDANAANFFRREILVSPE